MKLIKMAYKSKSGAVKTIASLGMHGSYSIIGGNKTSGCYLRYGEVECDIMEKYRQTDIQT